MNYGMLWTWRRNGKILIQSILQAYTILFLIIYKLLGMLKEVLATVETLITHAPDNP